MRARVLSVLLSAVLMAVALGGFAMAITVPEAPYAEPTDCLSCHTLGGAAASAPVDFAVGAVDKNACKACHGSIPLVGYEDHFHGGLSSCSGWSGCHGWPYYQEPNFDLAAGEIIEPLVTTPYGKFQTATSPDADIAAVHAAHRGLGWVQTQFAAQYPELSCQNCHGEASCSVCHTGTVSHGTHGANTCLSAGCHVLSTTGISVPTCASCHPSASAATHDVAHSATDDVISNIACSECHTLALVDEHAKATSTSAESACAACHPAPAESTAPGWDGTCATASCHTSGSAAPMHANATSAHAVSSGNALCLDCHSGTELGSVHATATSETDPTRTSCLVCHSAAAAPATSDCTTCHFTFADHYDSVQHTSSWAPLLSCGGTGCHSVSGDLMTVHEEHRTVAEGEFTCFGCHDDFSVAMQIEQGLTGCGDCHENIYQSSSHRAVHWPVPLLQDEAGPHYSYYTGSMGTAPTGDCAGCHTSNLVDEHMGLYLDGYVFMPRKDAAGNDLTCDTCHGSTDPRVAAAIAGGTATCESCHDVHGPMQNVHASTFVDTPEMPCADCHSANLAEEHNGTYTSSAGLTGCDVCHALYTTSGEMGVTVQSAIAVTNDTRCTACHSAYHTSVTPHEAIMPASMACTECHGSIADGVVDVNAIHPSCSTCHSAAAGRIDWATATFECADCHAEQGVDFHQGMTAHATPTVGCSVSGCHHSSTDVSTIHPAGCSTCHTGAADLGKTTACENCHGTVQGTDYHVAFDSAHTPSDAVSLDCAGCHDTTNVTDLHVTNGCDTCHFQSGCGDCHEMHMSGAGLTRSTACDSCHVTEGTDYHGEMTGSHTFSAMPASCTTGGNCHVASTLPEEHARFITEYGYASTCDLCHENTDPARIDWTTATADCLSCHEVHGDIDVIHTTTESQACVDCHESADLRTMHGDTPDASCGVCHGATAGRIDWLTATAECVSCHGALSPVDGNHYPVDAHNASAETGCNQCHYRDMKAEHFKATVAVSCVTCHEVKVDAFTTAWDKTCAACHPTKHGDRNTKHGSTNTACSGTACHNVSDVAALHDVPQGAGCGACHIDAGTPASTTDCTVCHAGVGTNHHEAHNGTSANPNGCGGCHNMYLDDEHASLGMTCGTCHDSTVTAVVTAIASGDLRCLTCHPDSPHNQRQSFEFNPGTAGGHRVRADLPAMQSTFSVAGKSLTWSLPSASSFLKSGWTTSSIMSCDGCHTYSGATGPHGASMQVNIDPAYPRPYRTAFLQENGSLGMNADTICAKCHDLNGTSGNFSNKVHDKHARTEDGDRSPSLHRQGPGCVTCHVGIPHAWGRPRLIGYQTDPAPYATDQTYGIQAISLRSYTSIQDDGSSGWDKSYCAAECGGDDKHPLNGLSGTAWPAAGNTQPTTGTVSGTVSKSTGGALSGATVGIAGKTATASSTGTYSVTGIAAGTYTMTVSATGYTSWSGPVTITAGATATQNVTLTASSPTPTTGTVTGTITNASTSAAIAGATVTVGGKTATTGSSGTYSVADVPEGSQTLTVTAVGYQSASVSVTVTAGASVTKDVSLTSDGGAPAATNLARTGTASASSSDGWNYAAAKAIDGYTSTYWRSSSGGNQWLRVDLRSARTFDKVVVRWSYSRYARSYRIETSIDGTNWTSRYATSSGSSGSQTITFPAVSARYVRIYCTQANDSDYRITEFEVWGY